MKKILNSFVAILMITLMIFSTVSVASAATVARVSTPKASKRTATTVTVKWSKVGGAKGYELYRANATGVSWELVATTTSVSYTAKSLTAGTKYRFRVRAYKLVDGQKQYGRYSPTLTTATLPAVVKSLKASSKTDTTLTLKWNTAKGAKGYQVYMLDKSTGKYKKYGSTTSTTITVKSLSPNTTYSFKVRAYHELLSNVSYGSYSSVLKATTKSTDVTGLKLKSATASSYTISWSKAKNVDGYNLCVYDTSQGKWVTAKNTTGTSYTVSALSQNSAAKYKIRSYKKINGSKNYGVYTDEITAGTLPSAPTGLECSVNSDNGISIKWNTVPNATGYEISEYKAANGTWETLATTTNNTYSVTDLTETTTHTYKVRAYVGTASNPLYGEYCESVSVFYQSNQKPDSIYTQQLEESGIFGYLYDPAENCFYTSSDPWQRTVGYNVIFDYAAPLTLIYIDTYRFPFEYAEKDWVIQAWKGQYGLVFYGAEIGVYTKPSSRVLEHYDCASDGDMLMMSMEFYEKKTSLFSGTTWKKQFARPYGLYWWCTGFIPGNRVGRFDNLRVDARITMKDYTMLSAFKASIEKQGVTYTVQGLDVYFSY